MKIKVLAPAFADLSSVDEDGYVTLEEGSTLNSLYKKLKIPLLFRPMMISSVNYKKAGLSQKLRDGDTVTFLTLLKGG